METSFLFDVGVLLRPAGARCFLATDQDHLRKGKLLDDLDFLHQFDGWFVSAEIGFRKVESGFWHRVLQALAEALKVLLGRGRVLS